MPFQQAEALRYYTFDSLAGQPLIQAVFTRTGGVSQQPWASLNLGGTVGDDPQAVQENRQRAFQAVDLHLESMYDVWQVHSSEVVVAHAPRPPEQAHLRADAILTDRPGVTLFMRFADCVPILLYDPHRRAIGLVHAGWLGTVNQVAALAVQAMRAAYHCEPGDIMAAIGPSIGAHHYEVGQEVVDQARAAFGQDASDLLQPCQSCGSGVQFDLWAANQLVLQRAGVKQIEIAGLCTACDLQAWFSHRGEKGKTGRFGALLALAG